MPRLGLLPLSVFSIIFCCCLLARTQAFALIPDEVVVIANTSAWNSLETAEYYMHKRGIPKENLIKLQTTWHEECDRTAYHDQIAVPVREALLTLLQTKRIRALVTVYGVPLKIKPPLIDFDAQEQVQELKEQIGSIRNQMAQANNQEKKRLEKSIKPLQNQIRFLTQTDTRAAVDSELALVLSDGFPLDGWLPNPYFLGFQQSTTLLKRDNVLIVSRLDGPDHETVRRIIDDTLAAEKKGLSGTACIDARWKMPDKKTGLSGYALYDASLHKAAEIMKSRNDLKVILNQQERLFQKGECEETAIYSGWYSLARYVDAFTWKKGSIGYHIASAECATLKKADHQVWCKRMLEQGAAATIGPVYEPYVQGFPLPEIFFTRLIEGYLSLGESYLVSLPYLSWQMVLVGDPLYRPFKPIE